MMIAFLELKAICIADQLDNIFVVCVIAGVAGCIVNFCIIESYGKKYYEK